MFEEKGDPSTFTEVITLYTGLKSSITLRILYHTHSFIVMELLKFSIFFANWLIPLLITTASFSLDNKLYYTILKFILNMYILYFFIYFFSS